MKGKNTLGELLQGLYTTYEEQMEVSKGLNDCVQKQTEGMSKNDLDVIKKTISELAYWAERFGTLGEKHLAYREQLEHDLNLPPETELSTILEHIPDRESTVNELKVKITQKAGLLRGLMEELKSNVDTAHVFMDRAQGFHNRILNSLSQKQGESYTKEGKMPGDRQSLLNKKG